MKLIKSLLFVAVLFGMSTSCTSQKSSPDKKSPATDLTLSPDMNTEYANLAGGCFWCVEAVFQELNGVIKVESGYMGGKVVNPTYKEVCTGTTGHAELARITFDPAVISFAELLEVFWTTHDPTTLNRQGNDVGTQYRSAIFYVSDEQREIAEKSKREVAPTIWNKPIVTEIVPAETFYPAEDYHQDYFANNPDAGYCRMIISPKVEKVRSKYSDKLKK